ncbi:MAG: molybdopterin-dependent oxidoreductase [Alphaproteobacteria bacterium]|nr:molybdopterin-dependent oxidoreductase [Alphaproteobacteria bacterium]
MDQFGIGQPVRRKEDARFVTGAGRFTDDIDIEGQAHAVVLRSPHAHARIASLDTGAAEAAPGVVAVFTGQDAAADGLPMLPCQVDVPGAGGARMADPGRAVLQADRVRYVGDAVAFVVAETAEQARDAAELVKIEYEVLPAICTASEADAPGAPVLHESVGSNLCVHWLSHDGAEVEAAFAQAAKTVRVELANNRVVGNPMEPRVAIGQWEAEEERYLLHSPTQGAVRVRNGLADIAFDVPKDRVRVVSPDVGGGFGLRGKLFPETVMVLWAARRLGRPVKWRADRQETMLADPHGRDHLTVAEMAFDGEGRILGMKAATPANLGG